MHAGLTLVTERRNAGTSESVREGQKLKVPLHHTPPPKHKHFSQIARYCSHSHNFLLFSPSYYLSDNTASFYTPAFGFSISQFLFTAPPRVVSPALTRGELAIEKSPNAYVATDKLCSARLRFATRRHARLSFSVGQCCFLAPPPPHARARREVMWSGSRPMIG